MRIGLKWLMLYFIGGLHCYSVEIFGLTPDGLIKELCAYLVVL